MNKKIIIRIVLIVLIVIAGGFFVLQKKETTKIPETIKIGWPTPITGHLSNFGEPNPWMAKYVTEVINVENGGLYLKKYGKKVPIEILIRDTASDVEVAASVTEDLIVEEEVDMIVVLHTPETVIPVTSICEKYNVPCVAFDCPVFSWVNSGPYEWSYLHFWPEPDVVEAHLAMWDLVKDQTNMKAGGLWNNDADGHTFRKAHIAAANAHGYDFVVDGGYTPYGLEDYSPYITQFIENDVELFVGTFIPPDFARFWRQANEMGFHPKVVTVAKAILFPSALEEIGGDLPLGLTTEVWWSKYHPSLSPLTGLTSEGLADKWEAESGKQWTQPLFYSLGAFETALDALVRTGSLDKEEIKKSIADTDLDTIVGHVSFKAPLSQDDIKRYEKWPELIEHKSHYSLAPVVGGQWVKGVERPWEIEIVYNWKYNQIPETREMILIPK